MNHVQMWKQLKADVEATFSKFQSASHKPRHYETPKGQIVFESPRDAVNAGSREMAFTILKRMNELEGKKTKSPILLPKGVPYAKHF